MDGDKTVHSADNKTPFFYGHVVVAASFFMMVVIFGSQNSFGVFFKPMLTDFGWNRTVTSGAFSLSMFISGLSSVLMGRIGDRFGPRVVMTISAMLIGAGYLLMSSISEVWHIYLFYGVILGFGMGGVYVTLGSMVARWFVRRRSLMTGVVFAGTGTGALVIPPLATRLIAVYDWPVSYLILGTALIFVVVLTSQFLRRDPAIMGLLPYGQINERAEATSTGVGISFRDSLNTVQLWQFVAMCVCLGFTMFAVLIHIVPHATDLGVSATSAASIMIVIGAFDVIGRLVMGGAADRIGNRRAFIIGFVLMSVILFWLAIEKEAWMLYPFAALFGFAYSTMGTSMSPMVARLFGLKAHGSIYGVAVFGFQFGSTLGPLLAGYMFDASSSYEIAFLVCAGISVAGLALSVLLKPVRGGLAIKNAPVRL